MFGSNNSAFGAFGSGNTSNTASPFGKPAFGAAAAAPTFGTPAVGGASGGGLFGQGTAAATPAPAFGSAAATQATPFGGFGGGATAAAGTGLFGAPQQQQQQQNAPLFGGATPAVGTTSAFGQPQQSAAAGGGGGGFMFGAAPAASGGSLFGQPTSTATPGASVFGASSGGFGAAAAPGAQAGGTTVKFAPVTGTDTVFKGSVQQPISIKLMSISVMNEYNSKSFEELRMADYLANRKGPQRGAFGQPTAASSTGLFGASTQTAVAPAPGGGLFGAAATPNRPLFGAATTATGGGLFGASTQSAAGGGLFGAAKPTGFVAPSTSAPAFGAFGQSTPATGGFFGANQQQPQQQKSLFGSTTAGGFFGAAASTAAPTTGAFGSTQPVFGGATTGGGLFGAASSAPTSGFSFGQTPATAASTGAFGTFGKPAAASGGGGLFGASTGAFGQTAAATPAVGTSGFSFGATKPAAAAGGFSFGTAPRPTGTAGVAGFGTGAAGGSLFNTAAKPTGLSFGQPAGGASAGGLFGAATATPSFGGFGGSQLSSGGLFSQPAGLGAGSLAAGSAQQQQQQQQQQQHQDVSQVHQLIMSLTSNQFGDLPLFRNLPESSVSRQELLSPTNPSAHKNVTQSSSSAAPTSLYKVSPLVTSKLRPRPLNHASANSSLFDGLDDEPGADTSVSSLVGDVLTPRRSVKKLDIKAALSPASSSAVGPVAAGTPSLRRSALSSPATSAYKQKHATVTFAIDSDGRTAGADTPELIRAGVGSSSQASGTGSGTVDTATPLGAGSPDDTIQMMGARKSLRSVVSTAVMSPLANPASSSSSTSLLDITASAPAGELDEDHDDYEYGDADTAPNSSGVTLRRAGYYTIPALDQLSPDPVTGRLEVDDLTVGRHAYGSVYFAGRTDITALDLDRVVFFRRREVCVYPDDSDKPQIGHGLNRPAQVTLERVWPTDKTTREPITCADRLTAINWEQRLERACLKLGSKFVEYRPETGSWVFKVDHFSKYGLNDSDDECDSVAAAVAAKTAEAVAQLARKPQPPSKPDQANGTDKPLKPGLPVYVDGKQTEMLHARERATSNTTTGGASRNGAGLGHISTTDITDDIEPQDGAGAAAVLYSAGDHTIVSCLDTDKLHNMRASLFADDDDEGIEDDQGSQMGDAYEPTSAFRAGLVAPGGLAAAAVPTQPATGGGGGLGGSLRLFGRGGSAAADVAEAWSLPASPAAVGDVSVLRQKCADVSVSHMEPGGMVEGPELNTTAATMTTAVGGGGLLACDRSLIDSCRVLDTHIFTEPAAVVPHYFGRCRPLSRSTRVTAGYQLCDLASMMGGRWRIGWTYDWQVCHAAVASTTTTLSDQLESFSVRRSCVNVMAADGDLNLTSGSRESQLVMTDYADMMAVLLDHSSVVQFKSDDAVASPVPPLFSVDETRLSALLPALAAVDRRHADVWRLVDALWGQLHVRCGLPDDVECTGYVLKMCRRESFSRWLQSVCESGDFVRDITSRLNDPDADKCDDDQTYLATVFAYLSVRQVYEAVELCTRRGDLHLTLLLSQVTGSREVSKLVHTQLENWLKIGADRYISPARLRVYVLLAGLVVWETSDGSLINVCAGLSWLQALALHTWYLCPATASVTDILDSFESSWSSDLALCSAPLPDYFSCSVVAVEPDSDPPPLDVRYQLLQLYCHSDSCVRLERLLVPDSHTSCPLDHQLSWMLLLVLEALGYRQLSSSSCWARQQLHHNMAAQLCVAGAWQLAVYALLHVHDQHSRTAACRDLLTRHVTLDLAPEVDDLLRRQLRLPVQLIAGAQAVRARHLRRRRRELEFLLLANRWQEAHDLLVQKIAPGCVINEQYDYLRRVLSLLIPSSSCSSSLIDGWQRGGQLYVDYLSVCEAISGAGSNSVQAVNKLTALKCRVHVLCDSLLLMPSPSPTHVLARAEIARKCVALLRILLHCNVDDDDNVDHSDATQLLQFIDRLQLPEDYALEELMHLLCVYTQRQTPVTSAAI